MFELLKPNPEAEVKQPRVWLHIIMAHFFVTYLPLSVAFAVGRVVTILRMFFSVSVEICMKESKCVSRDAVTV